MYKSILWIKLQYMMTNLLNMFSNSGDYLKTITNNFSFFRFMELLFFSHTNQKLSFSSREFKLFLGSERLQLSHDLFRIKTYKTNFRYQHCDHLNIIFDIYVSVEVFKNRAVPLLAVCGFKLII